MAPTDPAVPPDQPVGRTPDPVPAPVRPTGRRTAALLGLPFAILAAVVAFLLLVDLTGNRWASPQAPQSPQGSAASGAAPTGPVPLAVASLDATATAVCRALVAALPQQLRDRQRRPVAGGEQQNAAWGSPATTLACGAAVGSTAPDAQLWLLDGVCWFSPDGMLWHTVDRAVPVTVTLDPTTGAGTGAGGQWVIELSAPIAATDPVTPTRPAGCR